MKEILFFLILLTYSAKSQGMEEKYTKHLSEEEKIVIVNKGTEKPFTGKFNDFYESGIYVCKACGSKLYESLFLVN